MFASNKAGGAGAQGLIRVSYGAYNLTVSSTSGGSVVSLCEGTLRYLSGTQVNLIAVPDTGYQFVLWSDGSTDASRTYTVTGNASLKAYFVPQGSTYYTLTYTAGAGGSISGDSHQAVVSGGSGSAVTPVPNAGYHFTGWSGGSTANPRTDTGVSGNINVTANFVLIEFVYYSTYSGEPDSYWKYTWIGQYNVPAGSSDGGFCNVYQTRIYSDAACTAPMNPNRVASSTGITVLSPGLDFRSATGDLQLRMRYSAATSLLGNVTNYVYYRSYTAGFGAPLALSETWTYHETTDSTNSLGDLEKDFSAAVAASTESKATNAGTYTCYKVTCITGEKSLIEWWDTGSTFPYAPVAVTDGASFDAADTRILQSSTVLP